MPIRPYKRTLQARGQGINFRGKENSKKMIFSVLAQAKKSVSSTYSKYSIQSKDHPFTTICSDITTKSSCISKAQEEELVNRLSIRNKPNPNMKLKELTLWEQKSFENRWFSPKVERQSRKAQRYSLVNIYIYIYTSKDREIERRCLSESRGEKVKERDKRSNPSRERDFSSQLSNIPGPNHLVLIYLFYEIN